MNATIPICKCLFLLLVLCHAAGCSPGVQKGNDEVIAYVNGEPVFASELQRVIELKLRQNPVLEVTPEIKRSLLEVLIDKKLITQEAMDEGLARKDRFLDTIKVFWEQTLVRYFYDYKTRELRQEMTVTEREIVDFYDRLKERVTFRVLRSPDESLIDGRLAKLKGDEPVNPSGWETIGPVGYEDLNSPVLVEAFGWPAGTVKKVKGPSAFYLVEVLGKEPVDMRPLDDMREAIRQQILSRRERFLFEAWLENERQKAEVRITRDLD